MKNNIETLPEKLLILQGERIILDADLATIYGVKTYRLNEAVKRNSKRFPKDFMFQLTRKEAEEVIRSRSQNAILKRGKNIKYLPYAFTEHGALMAANILRTAKAIRMSVFVVRAFIKIRQMLSQQQDLAKKLQEVEKELKGRLDIHEAAIVSVLQRIMQILDPPPVPVEEEKPKRRMGFNAD